MDLKTDGRALLLIRQLFDPTETKKARIETQVQKPAFAPSAIREPFPRDTPESQGVPSAHVSAFIEKLRADPTLDPHRVAIYRNGTRIASADYGAYDESVWHITHSECKSITGLAIGMLIDEKKLSLDDKVTDLLAERTNKITALTHKAITVKHLLTMTSGIAFNEAGSVTETDWVKCFFESAVLTEPGSTFNYNSMNTYMLSSIVKAVTGQKLSEYLKPRLFAPLGIENFFWETCPMGTEKGGWGLYILPEDIAKIGQLILNRGLWHGKRLVSEHYIQQATTKQAEAPEALGAYNYGYQIWVGRKERSFLFNGMFGQNVLGYFDSNVLIVSNAGNNELFQQSNFYPLASEYFANVKFKDASLPRTRSAKDALERAVSYAKRDLYTPPSKLFGTLIGRRDIADVSQLSEKLAGKRYKADDKRANSVGLYPLYAQALQNNYTKGLAGLSFNYVNKVLSIVIEEADEKYVLPIGFASPLRTSVILHGEPHLVGVSGRFTTDENETPVLRIRVSFLESACSRLITLYFEEDKLISRWAESPGKDYILGALESVKSQVALVGTLLEKADDDMIAFGVGRALEPEVILIPKN